MKRVFVDSNVFLRFFTDDDPDHRRRAAKLLRDAAAGKIALIVGPPVMFEIAWSLRSTYGLERDRVLDIIASISALPNVALTDAYLVDGALRLARATGSDFPDAYIATSAEAAGAEAIATFNRKDFTRLGASLHDL
jgi:predicted nucleic acid-binding protein